MTIKDVLHFWFEELEPGKRFFGGEEVDNLIRDRFLDTYEEATKGKLDHWRESPDGTLAIILVLDQFSRNMFRGDARSFKFDHLARQIAEDAIARDLDLDHAEERRGFYYLPYMHSEDPKDQAKCIELISTRLGEEGKKMLIHAKAHADIINEFERFPYRNDVLGRKNTAEETAFLDSGGYIQVVRKIEAVEGNV